VLYHGTAQSNLPSTQLGRVLHSPATLAPDRFYATRSAEVLVRHEQHVIALRDQLALRQSHVELTGGWCWNDLITALNSRVFFWPGDHDGPNRFGYNFFEGYRKRGQSPTKLRVDFRELLQANPNAQPYFCKFNSGAPRTTRGRKSPRGPDTFRRANEWHDALSRVAEVSFIGNVALPSSIEVWDDTAGWRAL
jgi:hypothetical protein